MDCTDDYSSSKCRTPTGLELSQQLSTLFLEDPMKNPFCTLPASKNVELVDSYTGKLSSIYARNNACLGLQKGSKVTGSLRDLKVRGRTASRKIRESKVPSLRTGRSPVLKERPTTGILSVPKPKPVTWNKYRRTYTFVAIIHSKEYEWTTLLLSELKGYAMCIGVQPELANPEELGQKRENWLTLRILVPNGGVATKVRKMLSLMSFEVLSESPTYCDGLTDILSLWKPKAVQSHLLPAKYGLLQTWIHGNGTQNWTSLQDLPYYGV